MIATEANSYQQPTLAVVKSDDGQMCVKLSGNWNLRSLISMPELQKK
jgi:phospholipid/cholesterol/gamma-HCH transport system permease protein